jgi:endonuclease/exonuclease/phosphatase family metal-dependent hydrolase
MHLRILTLNVWNEEGEVRRRLALINRELRRLAPDIVALQEVVYTSERNQLDQLLDGTGLSGVHQVQVMAAPILE